MHACMTMKFLELKQKITNENQIGRNNLKLKRY